MTTCTNTDITQEQSNTLLQTITVMVSADYPPYTIVDYVCAELGIPTDGVQAPEINNPNWCLLICVSSCIYSRYSPAVFAYTNKSTLYTCITTCFPTLPEAAKTTSSGGSCAGGRTSCVGNCNKWKADRLTDFAKRYDLSSTCLNDAIIAALAVLAITCSSYSARISILSEHLMEIILADITKKIGSAIDWIAKIYKMFKDMLNSVINWGYTAGESDITGHFIKATQDALTTLQGYITDNIKNLGQYIEQIGEFLYDLADRTWNMKDISNTVKSLSAMIAEVYIMLGWTNQRQQQVTTNTSKCGGVATSSFTAQAANAQNYANTIDQYKATVADTINSQSGKIDLKADSIKEQANNIISSITSSKYGVSIS